jgi:hypothetical protein
VGNGVCLFEAVDSPVGVDAGGRAEVAAVAQVLVTRTDERAAGTDGAGAAAAHAVDILTTDGFVDRVLSAVRRAAVDRTIGLDRSPLGGDSDPRRLGRG